MEREASRSSRPEQAEDQLTKARRMLEDLDHRGPPDNDHDLNNWMTGVIQWSLIAAEQVDPSTRQSLEQRADELTNDIRAAQARRESLQGLIEQAQSLLIATRGAVERQPRGNAEEEAA